MRLSVTAALTASALAAPAALADFTDFDSHSEGFKGSSFVSNGITFFNANNVNGYYPDGQPFTPADLGTELIIEDSTYAYNDFPDVISPYNTLTFGTAFVPGPNLSLGALATVSMTNGQLNTSGSFDIIYYDEPVWEWIEVTLEATLAGAVVASNSFVIHPHDPGGRNIVDTRTMSITGVTFDTLRVYSKLNGEYTTCRALVDDVTLVPSPGAALALGFTGLLGVSRRRR